MGAFPVGGDTVGEEVDDSGAARMVGLVFVRAVHHQRMMEGGLAFF